MPASGFPSTSAWPDDGARPLIHAASDEAVQLHSGCADTVTAFLPPAASIEDGASSDTWHFTGEGPVDVLDVESHPIKVTARPSTSVGPRILRMGALDEVQPSRHGGRQSARNPVGYGARIAAALMKRTKQFRGNCFRPCKYRQLNRDRYSTTRTQIRWRRSQSLLPRLFAGRLRRPEAVHAAVRRQRYFSMRMRMRYSRYTEL